MANSKQTNEVRVPIREDFVLPSGGKLYGNNVSPNVTLRAMTTMDEKTRLSSSGLTSVVNLLNSCVVSPDLFNASELKMFDVEFLLYKLRTVTYGNIYKVRAYCDHCGKYVDIDVDLDSLTVNTVPDDFSEPFDIGKLPVSGDKLECRILSIADSIEMSRESQKILNKYKDYEGDPSYILTYKYMIYTVNGEVLPDFKKQAYVENMHAMDSRYLEEVYGNMVNGFGLDTLIDTVCPICGSPMLFDLPITDEFFRPKIATR